MIDTSAQTEERYVRRRTVHALAPAVFAVLTDPDHHQDTEPGDWVRGAVDPEPLTRAGQVFAVNMFMEAAGGPYVMHNRVTAFEPDQVIEWEPGQPNDHGELEVGGWFWRYDLRTAGDETEVTLTYDWSRTPAELRAEIGGMPPFGPEFIEQSLAALEGAVTAPAD